MRAPDATGEIRIMPAGGVSPMREAKSMVGAEPRERPWRTSRSLVQKKPTWLLTGMTLMRLIQGVLTKAPVKI